MVKDVRKWWPITCLVVSSLLLFGCAPTSPTTKPVPTPAQKPVEGAASPEAKPGSVSPTPKPSAEQPRYGGILTITNSGDPQSLDIHQENMGQTVNAIQAAYSGVTQFDPNNPEEVIGDLAKSWEVSKDGLTYTFSLHENVKFHDGTPLTSQDVKYSFERQINPPRGIRAERGPELAALAKIEAPDTNGVKFTLKYPSSAFLYAISTGWMVIYSQAFVEKKGHMKNDVIGTGPYKLKRYSPGVSLEYVKNPDYFVKGRPYLDGITFYIIKDGATRLAAFRTGQVKLTGPSVSALTAADAEVLKKTMPQAVIVPYPSFYFGTLRVNTQQPPWTDARVRKAVHLVIDRQSAILVLLQGYGELGSNFPGKFGIPKDELAKMPGFRQPKDADIAEAKRLLAEAGHPNGFTAKALTRADDTRHRDLGEFMANELAKVNIKLEPDLKETAVWRKAASEGAFSVLPGGNSFIYPDPNNAYRLWGPPIGGDWIMNWQRNSDPVIWDLFDKQSRAVDPQERIKILHELDRKMIESGAADIVYWSQSIMGMWPEVRDRGKVQGNHSFQKYQDIWLAK